MIGFENPTQTSAWMHEVGQRREQLPRRGGAEFAEDCRKIDENDIATQIIGAAIEVHRVLGPGLLESVYQRCLARELELRNIPCATELPIQASYKGLEFDMAYRMDMLVSGRVVVELKVTERLLAVHEAQLLSYLRFSGKKLGLLINFHVPVLKAGIKRVANGL